MIESYGSSFPVARPVTFWRALVSEGEVIPRWYGVTHKWFNMPPGQQYYTEVCHRFPLNLIIRAWTYHIRWWLFRTAGRTKLEAMLNEAYKRGLTDGLRRTEVET